MVRIMQRLYMKRSPPIQNELLMVPFEDLVLFYPIGSVFVENHQPHQEPNMFLFLCSFWMQQPWVGNNSNNICN